MDAKTAARIQALKGTQGWDDLTETLATVEEKFWSRHRADLEQGKPVDQRELDRQLGKFDGIRAILRAPETAAAILLREQSKEVDS